MFTACIRDVTGQLSDTSSVAPAAGSAVNNSAAASSAAGASPTTSGKGQFVPFSAAQKATVDNTPINAIQLAKGANSEFRQSGEASDPNFGYKEWTGILSTLQSLQGTPESVNAVG
jgi:hypothetical protein